MRGFLLGYCNLDLESFSRSSAKCNSKVFTTLDKSSRSSGQNRGERGGRGGGRGCGECTIITGDIMELAVPMCVLHVSAVTQKRFEAGSSHTGRYH